MDITIDQRLKALELAQNSMYYDTVPRQPTSNGYIGTELVHKDMREIFRRADRFLAYATGIEEADAKALSTNSATFSVLRDNSMSTRTFSRRELATLTVGQVIALSPPDLAAYNAAYWAAIAEPPVHLDQYLSGDYDRVGSYRRNELGE